MKTINDLRATLFDTLAAIKAGTLDIDRAKAINDVAQTIINSAKVEVDNARISGGTGSGFLCDDTPPRLAAITERTAGGMRTVQQLGNGATITRHRAS
jgi:hypothetical protein